ncbi:MAG: VCBS repeat-containing protein [Acidobacteriota bacterium]|nr:VCBS repeat-containing protein [Acidobacteriota bacterium]
MPKLFSFSRRFWIILAAVFLVGVGVVWLQVHRMNTHAVQHASAGKSAIKMLGEISGGIAEKDLSRIMGAFHDAYRQQDTGLWLEQRRPDREDGIQVFDWVREPDRTVDKEALQEWWSRYLAAIDSVQLCKFKLASLETTGEPAGIRATLWVRGTRVSGEVFETQARFRLSLTQIDRDPKVIDWNLLGGTTVIGVGKGFTNTTEEAGIQFLATRNATFDEDPDWQPQIFGIAKYSSAGVTTVDYDNDGWYDIFFANGGSAALYRNNGDGTFEDVTTQAGLPGDMIAGNVALFVDLDNDGFKDLFYGRFTHDNLLFRNNGDGSFTDVTRDAGLGRPIVAVASASDYDNDGDLDLYLGRYLDPRKNIPTTIFYTRNSEGNSLLRNDGNFRFTDVTEEAGVREGGLTLGTAWSDYDRDGDQDLYVANDFGRNALLRNNGDGTFKDISHDSDAMDLGYGMSATFADANNDGLLDIYVANVHSSNRWFGQAPILYNYVMTSIKQGTIYEDFPAYRDIFKILGMEWSSAGDYLIKGNSLLLNDGKGGFDDVAELAGANPFGWYWSSTLFDYDNDGRQDIYTVNGFVSGKVTDDL